MTDLAQTFRTHEVLLTGANGFLGKVIMGMLLDRFPDLRHLYVLVRPKGNLSPAERFSQEVLSSPALAAVAEKFGASLRQKVTVIGGDVGEPHCGIAAVELRELAGRVSVIINCAGIVEFYPPIDESFRSNVEGVRNVLALAQQLGAKVAHISTCFVCGEADGLIEETRPILGFYPHRQGPADASFRHEDEIRYCAERAGQIDDSNGNRRQRPKEVTRRLIDLGRQRAEHWGWVNTYTFAKSLGEQIIAAERDVESAIIRPAIIESALRFPFPGWIEGGRTSAPLVLMALGGMREWPVRRDAPLEVVPVDLVAAATLAITALLLDGAHEPVYQLGTADVHPILLEPLVEMLAGSVNFISPEQARARWERTQRRMNRGQRLLNAVRKRLERTGLPGRDALANWSLALRTRGLQANMRQQTLGQYLPFILHNRYIFESENIRAAYAQLSQRDRELLPWDPEHIDWREYWLQNQIRGIEKWIQPEAVKDWAFRI